MLSKGVSTSRCLFLDEIALKKGHGKFETVVSTERRVLTLLPGRTSQTLQDFLRTLPGIEHIGVACLDLCAPFAHALKQVLPKAVLVADRFHLIQKLSDTVDLARKRTHRQLDEKQRKRFSRIRFLLGQSYKMLQRDEKRLVKDYLRLNPTLKPVYQAAQQFRCVLFHPWQTRQEAYQGLWEWCEASRKYLRPFVKTVERWWPLVLNACLLPFSNGRQEGINHKLKLLKRQGYGFRNRELFRLKALAAFNP
jgi:transposase